MMLSLLSLQFFYFYRKDKIINYSKICIYCRIDDYSISITRFFFLAKFYSADVFQNQTIWTNCRNFICFSSFSIVQCISTWKNLKKLQKFIMLQSRFHCAITFYIEQFEQIAEILFSLVYVSLCNIFWHWTIRTNGKI